MIPLEYFKYKITYMMFISLFIFMRNFWLIVVMSIILCLVWCWKEEKSIGDSIPTEWEISQNTGVIVQAQASWVQVASMPQRVKDMWFLEPVDMSLDVLSSRQTSQDKEWYNSVSLIYTWSYAIAMTQAKRIADAVWLPIDKDFAMVQELIANWDDVDTNIQDAFEGVVYTNYSLTDTRVAVVKSITVEWDWRLIIDIVDYTAMKNK